MVRYPKKYLILVIYLMIVLVSAQKLPNIDLDRSEERRVGKEC